MLSLGSLLLAFNFLGASAIGLEAPRRLDHADGAQHVVNLRTAGEFAILTKTGVTTTGTTSVKGDIGTSPIEWMAITGFGLILDASNEFSTSALVDGEVYSANHAIPTPDKMNTAIDNMVKVWSRPAKPCTPR